MLSQSGVRDFLMNYIVRPERHPILYIPTPKCACTTMLHVLYYLDNNEWYDRKKTGLEIHKYYRLKDHSRRTFIDTNKDRFKFIVVREPVQRFVSAYANKVAHGKKLHKGLIARNHLEQHGLSLSPDINIFIANLKIYRAAWRSVKHHTDPQIDFIGKDLNRYDLVCKLEDLEILHHKLIGLTQIEFSLPHEQRSSSRLFFDQLTPESIQKLESFYAQDYDLLSAYYPQSAVGRKYHLHSTSL